MVKKHIDCKTVLSLLGFIVIITAFLFIIEKGYFPDLTTVRDFIQSKGAFGPVIFILIMIIAVVISPIPSLPLTISSGIIWGPYLGTLYSVIGGEIGAIISFSLARTLGKKAIEKVIHEKISFDVKTTDNKLFWVILIARVFPFFQFDILSYGAGLTRISLPKFALATLIGMVPTTFLFVKFGNFFVVPSWIGTSMTIILLAALFIVPLMLRKHLINFKG